MAGRTDPAEPPAPATHGHEASGPAETTGIAAPAKLADGERSADAAKPVTSTAAEPADSDKLEVELDQTVTALLAAISKRGVESELRLGVPDAGAWGDVPLGGFVKSVAIRDGVLAVSITGEAASAVWPRRDELKKEQPAITLEWNTGAAANARLGLIRSVRFGEEWNCELAGHEATFRLTGDAPRFWIAPFSMSWRDLQGNLVIRGASSTRIEGSQNNLRLDGAYAYYLVELAGAADPSHVLVVDVGENRWPDRETLGRDFAAMEFALGQALVLPELFGVDPHGRTVAWIGLGFEQHRTIAKRPRAPVPTRQFREPYAAELFRLVSRHQQRAPEALVVALAYYVEALFEAHLDGAYLKLQVALEATAKHLAQDKSGAVMIVKDRHDWTKWVAKVRDDLRALAAPGEEDTLLNKVRGAAFMPSGRRVEGAFKRFGIKVPDELRKEIALRNVVAHAALMSDPAKRDVYRDVRRVAQVQTLLAALVALAVGYAGRLTGWERAPGGEFEDAPAEIWKAGVLRGTRYWARYPLPPDDPTRP